MRHSGNLRGIGLKALGVFTALLILFGGTAGILPARAEEWDPDEIDWEDPLGGEYAADEDGEDGWDEDGWDEDGEYVPEDGGPDGEWDEEDPEEDEWDEEDPEDEADTDEDFAEGPDLTFEGGMAVFSAWDETYLRETDGDGEEPDEGEFLSFYVDVKSDGPADLSDLPAYYRLDGGTERPFSDVTQEEGNEARYHIELLDMAEMGPGLHEIEVWVGDNVVHTDRFYVPRDWDEIMPDPTEEQIGAVSGKGRSTYVVYYPQFENTPGITEYAIDFSVDDMNRGTYFSTFNAEMDTADFDKKGLSISENYGTNAGFYGGFQYLEDGRRAIIMTVWDVFCKDAQGNQKVFRATPLYADGDARIKSESAENSGEGDFQQFIIDYPWEARHPYRVLVQLGKNEATGNATATMQVCDLTSQEWKKLVTWDLGYPSEYIKTDDLTGFLENYLVQYSGDVRSANFSNIRGRSAQSGEWMAADSVKFTVNNSEDTFDYIGSFQFGSDGHSYYAITSGVDGLCQPGESGTVFTVNDPSDGIPY